MSDEQKELPGIQRGKHAPDNYRALCEPFPNKSAAEQAVTEFWEALYELRNKHRLADVTAVIAFNVLSDEGEEGQMMISMHAGNELMQEPMLAKAFGNAQAQRQDRIATAMAFATVRGRRDKP